MVRVDSPVRLGPQEIATLRSLAASQRVRVASHQRLRLEMLGLARDGPDGLRVTAAGRAVLDTAHAVLVRPRQETDTTVVKRDATGRRRANRRTVLD